MPAGAHTDFGMLTILASDEVPGLQIFTPGNGWASVPPKHARSIDEAVSLNAARIAACWMSSVRVRAAKVFCSCYANCRRGCFVINLGDMMERWSDGM
eukprot:1160048-Pelagomonas_calceolata.AAC.7